MLKLLTLFHLEYFISIGDRVPHISALSFDFPPTSFEHIYPNMTHCAFLSRARVPQPKKKWGGQNQKYILYIGGFCKFRPISWKSGGDRSPPSPTLWRPCLPAKQLFLFFPAKPKSWYILNYQARLTLKISFLKCIV